jgi:hypothetical protein
MARASNETSASSCNGPSDVVLLTASVTLDDGDEAGSWAAQAHLASFLPDADARHRLDLLAASIAWGRQGVRSLSCSHWAATVDRQTPSAGPQTALVLAIPASRSKVLDRPPAAVDLPNVAPVIVVTDDAAAFVQRPMGFVDGVVQAPLDDLLGAAVTVYRMVAALMAPHTFACTDLEDVLHVLQAGTHTRLCQPVWSSQAGLVFASPEEQAILESARGVLVQLDLEHFGSLRAAGQVRREVVEYAPLDCPVIMVAPVNFFLRSEWCPFKPVPLLCACP